MNLSFKNMAQDKIQAMIPILISKSRIREEH